MVQGPLRTELAASHFLILDGGLATELERRGADLGHPLWSAKVLMEDPASIQALHRDYFAAGADIGTSASYQASFEGFARRGLDAAAAAAVMRKSVALTVAARDEFWADESHRQGRRRPLVAASIGPYGAVLAEGSEYRGRYGLSFTELMNFHRPRLEALAAAGADVLALETVPSLVEAEALAHLVQELDGCEAWISFSCRDGAHTNEGQRIAECAQELSEFDRISAIGANCTAPRYITELIQELRSATRKAVIVYPNAGGHYDAASKSWRGRAAARPLASYAAEWREAGAAIIGGCCGTTPRDIRELRAAISRQSP